MEVFLPIAQVFVNPVEILLLSALVGVLSGLFGVGGGFLMTPFLIFMGIPPVYAVPNEVNNILATSVSGSLTHWYKDTLDYKMGLMIVSGGVVGTLLGITTFTYFSEIGKISLIISLLYMYLLAIVVFLVIPLILGSIVGVQLGQKIGQFLDSTELKSLFAMLLLVVSIAIGYDSFFREKSNEFNGTQILKSDLNTLAEFTVKFSNESPFLYGALAIILAISLGALTAVARKFLSPIIKKLLSDFRNKNQDKKKEIKFPEK